MKRGVERAAVTGSTVPGDGVAVELLGPLRVELEGRSVTAAEWPRRAQELVALLALAENRRLARDRVLEHLWPHLDEPAGGANLRKAAHHARRALDAHEAVVLRGGGVQLFPGRVVTTDVESFLHRATGALSTGDPVHCSEVAATCTGELLPDMLYEGWTQDSRRRVHAHLAELLRRSGDLERLVEIEPTDEAACRELMRAAIEAGRRHVAIRWYERLRIALIRELGVRPDAETRALYERCTSGVRLGEPAFVGRELELAASMGELGRVSGGGTGAVVVRGAIGIGKSALCREVVRRAADGGWRVLTTTSTASRHRTRRSPQPSSTCSAAVAPRSRRCPNAPGRCSPSSPRWPSRRRRWPLRSPATR